MSICPDERMPKASAFTCPLLCGVQTAAGKPSDGDLCVIAGAATSDIIEQYVSTIKTLREVDPTGDSLPQFSCKSVTMFIYSDSHTDHHLKGFASASFLLSSLLQCSVTLAYMTCCSFAKVVQWCCSCATGGCG